MQSGHCTFRKAVGATQAYQVKEEDIATGSQFEARF